ncbi:S41 family peptidase [Flavobacterium pedocola]
MKHFIYKQQYFHVSFLILLLLLISCKPPNTYNISPKAEKYLTEVITLLKRESVNKHTINWDNFRNDVFRVAQNSQTIKDTYPAITYAVAQLKDSHSYFAKAIQEEENSEEKQLPTVEDEKTPAGIGYIRIRFCIGDERQTEQYIKYITDKIHQQNSPQIKGWIIDLRDNFGGNMWAMMVAIGPFLDTGTQGYFIDADNKASEWRFENGKAYADTVMLAENKQRIDLFGKNRIAVLTNNKTASSGEAMAVLFKGYSSVKIFGTPTFGVSTGCESFSLSDGSRINLATSIFADRNRRKYGASIVPDFPCSEKETLSTAINWLYN